MNLIVSSALLLATLTALAGVLARRTLAVIQVSGQSMSPTLNSGDRVLVRRGTAGLRRGRIVVIARPHPEAGWEGSTPVGRAALQANGWYIKRATAMAGDPYPFGVGRTDRIPADHIAVIGDNPVSIDSRRYGACPRHQVLGVMIRRISAV